MINFNVSPFPLQLLPSTTFRCEQLHIAYLDNICLKDSAERKVCGKTVVELEKNVKQRNFNKSLKFLLSLHNVTTGTTESTVDKLHNCRHR